MPQSFDIQSFPSGPLDTNCYVLSSKETNEAAIIDPGLDVHAVLSPYLEERALTPVMILLTHSHWDHTADVHFLKEHYEIPVYVHPEDAPNLSKPGSDRLPLLFSLPPVDPDYMLSDGDSIYLGPIEVTVIHTPGHTPGGVCFYLPEEKVLFSGDTLFQGGIGNLSLPTAQPEKMWKSLEKLAIMDPQTHIYPGHGEDTILENEPWLKDARHIFGG